MRIAIVLVLLSACGGTPAPKAPVEPPHPIEATPVAMKPVVPPAPKHIWPETRTVDVTDQVHDVAVKDPYRWLEDEHSPEVQKWMALQDEVARAELAKL